jgi:hypothetical protein
VVPYTDRPDDEIIIVNADERVDPSRREPVTHKEVVKSEVTVETQGRIKLVWGTKLTLGKMREFVMEAEVAGLDDDVEIRYDVGHFPLKGTVGRVFQQSFSADVDSVPAYTTRKKKSKPKYQLAIKPAIYTGAGIAGFGLFAIIMNLLHLFYVWLPWT